MKKLATVIAALVFGLSLPAMAQSFASTPVAVGSGSLCFWFEGSSGGVTTLYGIQYPPANTGTDATTLLKIAGWRETVLTHPFGTVTGADGGKGTCDGQQNVQFLISITSP